MPSKKKLSAKQAKGIDYGFNHLKIPESEFISFSGAVS
jgi:hypothetical protein